MESGESVPSKHPSVTWRKMGEDSVVLNVQSESYYSLNEVGTRIWELIDGQTTPEEIALRIAEEYDAPPEEIQADVESLLKELREQELVD